MRELYMADIGGKGEPRRLLAPLLTDSVNALW
jgi:hypothetical protein